MSRVAEVLSSLGERGEGAYVPYLCAGDPDRWRSLDLIGALCEGGADLVEIGLPFSDPVADGPAIQGAMNRSLSGGFRCDHLFDLIASMREEHDQPVVVMSYYNPLLRRGLDRFCRELSGAGGDALLVVDLPPEESGPLETRAEEHDLDMIRLVTPTTGRERASLIVERASGFLYAVSVAGTTGTRDSLAPSARELLLDLEGATLPVMLGFGISSPAHAREAISLGASGVVEGSKLVSLYEGGDPEALDRVRSHAREMKGALRGR
ncbi:MAG: tryptophan synthase subunit alpha [Methanomassiliicoccales archaeon]